jgi:hypothetical protein
LFARHTRTRPLTLSTTSIFFRLKDAAVDQRRDVSTSSGQQQGNGQQSAVTHLHSFVLGVYKHCRESTSGLPRSLHTCKHDAGVAAGGPEDFGPQPLRPQHHPVQRQHAQRDNLVVVRVPASQQICREQRAHADHDGLLRLTRPWLVTPDQGIRIAEAYTIARHSAVSHPPKMPCNVDGESSWHSPVVSATTSAGSSCPSCTLYIARTASGSRTPIAASAELSCASVAPGLQLHEPFRLPRHRAGRSTARTSSSARPENARHHAHV